MKWGYLFIPVASAIFWEIIAVTFLLASGMTYLTLRRANRRRRAWRLAASYVAIFSLLALALQPQWLSSPRPVPALVITPGADFYNLSALADSLHTTSVVFAVGENEMGKAVFPQLRAIPDAAYLKRHFPEVNFLQMVGHGLNDYDWNELDSIRIEPHFSRLPVGIQQVYWDRELVSGQTLSIQGTLTGLNKEEYWLLLRDPGGVIDSIKITGPDNVQFAFRATPHETGKYFYILRLNNAAGATLCEENLAVLVTKPRPLKILVLENSVNFEVKYFKNWASQAQNAVVIRSTISRERYRVEYLNHPTIELKQISSALLRNFDIALIDGKTLRALRQVERQALRAAIEQEGLGILLIPDEIILQPEADEFSQQDFFLAFDLEAFTEIDRRLIKPHWPARQGRDITTVPAEPFALRPHWGLQPLIEDDMERLLAGAYHRGAGLIGLSLIRDSYRWILEGNAKDHAAYWSYLLTALARKDQDQDRWIIPKTTPTIVDQPLELTVETNFTQPLGLVKAETGEPDSIYLQQDLTEPQRWHGTFWPKATGWHQVAVAGKEAHWFYVYGKKNWSTWQAAQKIAATQRHVLRHANLTAEPRRLAPQARPISTVWFFVMFLASNACLWLERKL